MIAHLEPYKRQEYLRDERMLFVRTEGILQTMAKIPMFVASFIIVAIAIPFQNSFSSTRTLELIIYSDGSTHISSDIEVDPLQPDVQVSLFGTNIDNFVAVGENGFLLSSKVVGNSATIETFGSTSISIDYDTHDLISKEGRIWTFSVNSPSDFTLLMPKNSVIVGMSALPTNMELVDEKSKLSLPKGPAQIDYIFGTNPSHQNPPNPPTSQNNSFDILPITLGSGIIAAIAGGFFILKKSRKQKPKTESVVSQTVGNESLDPESIFKLRPDLRDDDKELVTFIFNNGGQALESELRKKFLQPRTTMWRAVKRLERYGVVEIEKKNLQNLVRLKKNLEEET